MRSACLSLALAFSSCGGEPAPTAPAAATTAEATSTSGEGESPAPAPSTAEPPPPPSPAPTLAFVIRPATGGVGISVANHGTEDVSLRSELVVEVDQGGTFQTAPSTTGLALRRDCAHEAERCVTLAPGAELLPPDWLGTSGDVQCACTRCGPVEPGDYRLVVTTCDGAHRVESNTLALPSP